MYPGIILYANIFIWKNLTWGNQKTLSLALTFWLLTSNLILLSSLFWLSDASFTWKVKSNQWEWHVRHRQGSQTSAWPLNLCPLLYTGGSALGSPGQFAWATQPCTEHLGSYAKPSGPFLGPLFCFPLLNCVVPGAEVIPNFTEFGNWI